MILSNGLLSASQINSLYTFDNLLNASQIKGNFTKNLIGGSLGNENLLFSIQTLIDSFKTRVANDGGTFEAESNLLSILNSVDSSIGLSKVNMLFTPNAFKTSKAYNVIGPTDFVVLRNTDATRFNSSGIVELLGSNIMRIDYSSGTPMILDEAQATNLFTYSNNFNDASYTKLNFIQNNLTTTSLDGTTILGYDFNNGYIFKDFATIAGDPFAFGLYIKANKTATIKIRDSSTATVDRTLTTNWTRVSASGIVNAASTRFILDNRTTLVADLKVWLYQSQAESGLALTSIIPTVAASVTRNADVITVNPPADTVRITTTFLNNSTEILNTIPATFTLPQGQIRQVVFQNAL
jgi:hypothetical protein